MYLPLILWSWQRWPVSSGGWSPLARHTPPPAWLRAWLCSPGQTSRHTLKTTVQKKDDHAHKSTPLDTILLSALSCRQTLNQLTISKHKIQLVWVDKNSQCILNWFTESLPAAWPVVKYNNKRGKMQAVPLSMGRNDQLPQVSKSFILNVIRKSDFHHLTKHSTWWLLWDKQRVKWDLYKWWTDYMGYQVRSSQSWTEVNVSSYHLVKCWIYVSESSCFMSVVLMVPITHLAGISRKRIHIRGNEYC